MMWAGFLLLILMSIGVVAYPLYVKPLQAYMEGPSSDEGFNEAESVLKAIAELEEDYQVGKVADDDYQGLKLKLQRQYLKLTE